VSSTGRAVGGRRLLGVVTSKVQTGHIVVKLAEEWLQRLPRAGWRVEYEGEGVIGLLVDIIGNVKEPYAVVKANDRSVLERVKDGDKVYIVVPKPKPPRRPRRGGRKGARRGGRRGARGRGDGVGRRRGGGGSGRRRGSRGR